MDHERRIYQGGGGDAESESGGCAFNKEQILLEMKRAAEDGAAVIVFPELCITGYSCRDLFLQESLLREAVLALLEIAEQTKDINAVVFVGLPYVHNGKLYNVAAALCRGQILGLVPKTICQLSGVL